MNLFVRRVNEAPGVTLKHLELDYSTLFTVSRSISRLSI